MMKTKFCGILILRLRGEKTVYGKTLCNLSYFKFPGWESGTFCNKGRTPAHVIEILTASTSAAYKAYLRKMEVSYIIAGEKAGL